MSTTEIGPVISKAGGLAIRDVGKPDSNILFWAAVQPGVISAELFQDRGSDILYHEASDELTDLIWDFWDAEQEDKRWSVMLLHVKGMKFNARLLYPNEIDMAHNSIERRNRLVKETLGDKPIEYPEWPDD